MNDGIDDAEVAATAHLQPLVAGEFLALADVLEAGPVEQWDIPSMCQGWRVREVVAHMTMAARYSQEQFTAELSECEFDFSRLSNRVAARDAELPTAELVADLRSDVMHHWVPPRGGYGGALNHVVVHGLDITVPLGSPRQPAPEAMAQVLDDLTRGRTGDFFEVAVDSRAWRATDLDWAYGTGPEVAGTAADLVLLLTGRKIPPDRLTGTPP